MARLADEDGVAVVAVGLGRTDAGLAAGDGLEADLDVAVEHLLQEVAQPVRVLDATEANEQVAGALARVDRLAVGGHHELLEDEARQRQGEDDLRERPGLGELHLREWGFLALAHGSHEHGLVLPHRDAGGHGQGFDEGDGDWRGAGAVDEDAEGHGCLE